MILNTGFKKKMFVSKTFYLDIERSRAGDDLKKIVSEQQIPNRRKKWKMTMLVFEVLLCNVLTLKMK